MAQDVLAWRKQVILVGVESTYGVDAVPTAGVLCGNINMSPMEGKTVSRDVTRQYFGNLGKVQVEFYGKISFKTEWAGAGTAGNAAPHGPLLKACNFSENLLAAAVTGTSQVGGSLTSIKLAAAASAVDDFYTGMSVSITGGTGNGQRGRIIDYVGSTKVATIAVPWTTAPDATSQYSIAPNAIYVPNSSFGTAAGTALTLYFNIDGVRHIMLGARGNLKPMAQSSDIAGIDWEFTGLIGTISDSALPQPSFAAWQTPVPVITSNVRDLNIMGYVAPALAGLNIDIGNAVSYRSVVNNEMVIIGDRTPTGSLKVEAQRIATFNWWQKVKDTAFGPLSFTLGTQPGNTVGIVCDKVQVTSPKYSEMDKVAMFEANLEITPTDPGNNEIRFIFE
jgi:hypothetical protein